MDTIGDRIKKERKELGLTQAELGKKLDLSDKAVSKWEQNEGNPDISTLVKLAAIFSVSIDYLLLGKEPEVKTVIKSPKEVLIETDDPSYLDRVNDLTISDMYENQLVNVFGYLCDSGKIKYYYGGRRNSNDYVQEILFLSLISNRLDKLDLFGFNDIGFAEIKDWSRALMSAFVNDERVTDSTRLHVLTTHCRPLSRFGNSVGTNSNGSHRYGNWQNMYPRFLEEFAVSKKWEWVKYILDVADSIDRKAMEEYNSKRNDIYNRYVLWYGSPTGFVGESNQIQVMAVNVSTLNLLLSEKQFNLLEQANGINALIGKETIDKKKIEVERMKSSSLVSEKERLAYEFTNNYILDIDSLLESNTIMVDGSSKDVDSSGYHESLLFQYKDIYREIITENPTSYLELTYRCASEKKLKKIFQIAVELDIKPMVEVCMRGNIDDIIAIAKKTFVYTRIVKNINNGEVQYFVNNAWILASKLNYRNGMIYIDKLSDIPENYEGAIEYFNSLKMQKYNEWVSGVESKITHLMIAKESEQEYYETKNTITRDYLMEQVSNGNEELAVVKLCVRLDALLKFKYGFSGELVDMMDSFFVGPMKSIEEKGPGFGDSWTRYLSRLRMKRNNIVHPEKNKVVFTTDDIKTCIEIVEFIDKQEAANE